MVTANLALRFVLELAALAAVGWWGWRSGGSTLGRVALAVVLPVAVAVVWGLFIAPKARFHVSKPVWYGLQVLIFGAAALALASVWTPVAGIALALIVVANTTLLAFAGERR
jgi:cytochrome b